MALRDAALAVTNATATTVRRLSPPSDAAWEITIEPTEAATDTGDDIEVSLPAPTDCAARGAVCTASGEPLANSPSVVVAGGGDA